MLSTFKKLFGAPVREVDDIMAPLNAIIAELEANSSAAAESGRKKEQEADYALAEAEELKRQKELEANAARQVAGKLYDTAAASNLRAEKLRGLFS